LQAPRLILHPDTRCPLPLARYVLPAVGISLRSPLQPHVAADAIVMSFKIFSGRREEAPQWKLTAAAKAASPAWAEENIFVI
jgi:hypothetical protein